MHTQTDEWDKNMPVATMCLIGSRALSFSDPYFHFTCLSVLLSFCLSVRNFGAKYLGNEAR